MAEWAVRMRTVRHETFIVEADTEEQALERAAALDIDSRLPDGELVDWEPLSAREEG